MSHLMFPARGSPSMRQVQSTPDLREESLASRERRTASSASAASVAPATWAESRGFCRKKPASTPKEPKSLDDIFQDLDKAIAARDQQRARRKEIARIEEIRKQKDQQAKEAVHDLLAGEEREPWAYCNPPGVFNPTTFDRDLPPSGVGHPHLQGSHTLPDLGSGWNSSVKPEHPDGTFRTKPKHRMFRTELVFAHRLEEATRRIEEMEHQDQLMKTMGSLKKQVLAARASPHSSLNRSQQAWVDPSRTCSDANSIFCQTTDQRRPPKAGRKPGGAAAQQTPGGLLPAPDTKLRGEGNRWRRSERQHDMMATA